MWPFTRKKVEEEKVEVEPVMNGKAKKKAKKERPVRTYREIMARQAAREDKQNLDNVIYAAHVFHLAYPHASRTDFLVALDLGMYATTILDGFKGARRIVFDEGNNCLLDAEVFSRKVPDNGQVYRPEALSIPGRPPHTGSGSGFRDFGGWAEGRTGGGLGIGLGLGLDESGLYDQNPPSNFLDDDTFGCNNTFDTFDTFGTGAGLDDGFIDNIHGGIDTTGMGGMAGDHNPGHDDPFGS
jgi:hypothetical protein